MKYGWLRRAGGPEEDGCHKLEDTCTQKRRQEDGREGGQGLTRTIQPWSSSRSSNNPCAACPFGLKKISLTAFFANNFCCGSILGSSVAQAEIIYFQIHFAVVEGVCVLTVLTVVIHPGLLTSFLRVHFRAINKIYSF